MGTGIENTAGLVAICRQADELKRNSDRYERRVLRAVEQLVFYMDSSHVLYGWLTSFTSSVFVRRIDASHIAVHVAHHTDPDYVLKIAKFLHTALVTKLEQEATKRWVPESFKSEIRETITQYI